MIHKIVLLLLYERNFLIKLINKINKKNYNVNTNIIILYSVLNL